ncbi:phytanoyl-CoA dioxygenase family protein [Micromonospora echinospora]|uniref:phytanoyl-CoA dioxygenase family protein n=1 Tax=Micromonospora echinospora TaxID=1877 RepID=UPI003CEC3ABF
MATIDERLCELTDEQRTEYATQGYIHLRGVLNEAEIDLGLTIVDRAMQDQEASASARLGYHASYFQEDSRKDLVRVRNAIAEQRAVAYFLDHPRLVGPMMSLIGPWLQVLGTEAFYRSKDPDGSRAFHEPWHIDGGHPMHGLRIDHTGRNLQVKAQIFLTDVSEPRSGNFLLIPGSHTRPATFPDEPPLARLNEQLAAGRLPEEALAVRAKPGDMLLFPFSLWHAVDCNVRAPRKSLILRFGHLWHRPHDYLTQSREVLDDLSPRLRRMFGDFGPNPHPMDYYKPTEQEAVMSSGGDYRPLLPAHLLDRWGANAYLPTSSSGVPITTVPA